LEVCQDRELSFFSGKAVGPAYGKGTFDYSSNLGARAVKISTEQGDLTIYYNGGCQFEGDFSNCKILGRYADLPNQPAAIIECQIGKGKAILSGVHLETPPNSLNKKDPYLAPLIPILEKTENKRISFWNHLLGHRP
jgi:biotin--protein ligase